MSWSREEAAGQLHRGHKRLSQFCGQRFKEEQEVSESERARGFSEFLPNPFFSPLLYLSATFVASGLNTESPHACSSVGNICDWCQGQDEISLPLPPTSCDLEPASPLYPQPCLPRQERGIEKTSRSLRTRF